MKVIITGEPGIGKTTLVKRVIEGLGEKAIGFWTEEVRDKRSKKRTGFRVISTEGKSELFASKFFTSKKLVGSYGVNVDRFERVALPVLERAKRERDKVLIVDEVGKMELFSKGFRDAMRELVRDRGLRAVITIPIRDVHPLVSEIRRLPEGVLIELDRENRDFMHEEILTLLEES